MRQHALDSKTAIAIEADRPEGLGSSIIATHSTSPPGKIQIPER